MHDPGPSRRAFLSGNLIASPVHISSAVVSVLPRQREEVMRLIATIPDVEIHHRSETKIVIVMEAADSGILGGRLAEIAAWPGVLSANMVFEQIERLNDLGD